MAEKIASDQDMGRWIRSSGAQGYVGINPEYKPQYDAAKAKSDSLAKELYELRRPAREAEEKRQQAVQDAAWDKEQERIKTLPVKERKNGWEIVTDGANYWVRHPETKEEIYKGKLARARAVAAESPPDPVAKSLSAGYIETDATEVLSL
jgi:hypothetical protein